MAAPQLAPAKEAWARLSEQLDSAKIAILVASVVAACLASVLLLARNRAYAALAAVEEADEDGDGIPDVYQR